MQNQWLVSGRLSGLKPPSVDADDPSLPPPADCTSPFSPQNFSPLAFPPANSSRLTVPLTSRKGSKNQPQTADGPLASAGTLFPTTISAPVVPICDVSIDSHTGSEKGIVSVFGTFQNPRKNYTTIPPKNSPILTNKASTHPLHTQPPSILPVGEEPSSPPLPPSNQTHILPPPLPSTAARPPTIPLPPSLVERIRRSEDKTLKRLAPVSIAPSGRPCVLIPDSVFQQGADLHKDFIICYFNGKAPLFSQIQSVFNHLWGKGKRLEIHNNPLNRTVLVRIQSDYLKQKILEKNIWHVGDSMFHTAQ